MELSNEHDYWCRTTFGESVKRTFIWTIEILKNRPEEFGKQVESSLISIRGSDDKVSEWKYEVYPKGYNSREYVAVFLSSKNSFPVTAKWEGWILDVNGTKTNNKITVNHEYKESALLWGYVDFILQTELTDSLLPGGNLTLVFEITVYGQGKTMSGSKDLLENNNFLHQDQRQKQVCDHLGQVLEGKQFSDLEIHCEETVFPCHQLVLAARSPVIRAMLDSDMVEKQTKIIIIKDAKPDIVAEMLNFIYTGDITNEKMDEMARALLGIADMYQLDFLKKMCEDKLCCTLEVDNSVECLVLGDSHNAPTLKMMAIKFIGKNITKIVDTDVYKDLFRQKPDLAWEVYKMNVQEDA